MANGASRIFNILKTTSNKTNTSSQFIILTVKSLNPLIFSLGDKLLITADFYALDENFDITSLSIGDQVNSLMLNDSQIYYILSNVNYKISIAALQTEINNLKIRVKALEDKE